MATLRSLSRVASLPILPHTVSCNKFSARLNLKGEKRFLQNCGNYVINYAASRLRRAQFSLPYAQHHARIRFDQVTPTHFTFLKIYCNIILSSCLASSSSPALEYPAQNFVDMSDSLSSPTYWREILMNREMHLKFVKINKSVFKKKGLKWSVHKARRNIRGVEIQLHSFLTSALEGGEWSACHPCRLISRKQSPVPIE
jgi:hypothetical protein